LCAWRSRSFTSVEGSRSRKRATLGERRDALLRSFAQDLEPDGGESSCGRPRARHVEADSVSGADAGRECRELDWRSRAVVGGRQACEERLVAEDSGILRVSLQIEIVFAGRSVGNESDVRHARALQVAAENPQPEFRRQPLNRLLSKVGAVGRPGVVLRRARHACFDGISVDVATQYEEVTVSVDEAGAVASFKKMPGGAQLPVAVARVAHGDALHGDIGRLVRHLQ
jgi:hypothetical protein